MIISKRLSKIIQLLLLISATLVITEYFATAPSIRAVQDVSNMVIQMSLVPSMIESGHSTYSLGYVNIVDNTGIPIIADQDIAIKLQSSNPAVASVPSTVIIPKKSNYAKFNVTTGNDGETTVSAKFNDQSVSQTLTVGILSINYPSNMQLVLNIPSTHTDANSGMIFSVFLQVNNTVVPAPNDVHIFLQYDNALIKPDNDEMVIKKGEYYAVGTINTLSKTGNAYLKATSDNPTLSAAGIIQISSTQPTSLLMFVFPTKIAYTETHFDVFVGLFDSLGHPAVASHDTKLRFTANDTLLSEELNKQAESSPSSNTIKKGDFGLYKRFQYFFVNTKNYTLYVNAPDLGISNATLALVQPLPLDSQFAANSFLTINTLKQMPPNATAIFSYQISSQAEHLIKGTQFIAEGQKYPSPTTKPYSTDPQFDNLQVVSTDQSIITVQKPAYVFPGYSYGTAIVSSGQKSGNVNLGASLKGIGSAQNSTLVFSTRDITSTEIFSPAGRYMVFDKNSSSTIYFVLLDTSNRPQFIKNGIQFLIQPTNNVVTIPPLESYSSIDIQSSQLDTSQNAVVLHAEPVGLDVNTGLASTTLLNFTKPLGSLKLNIGIQNLAAISGKNNPIGVVQVFDIYGNPPPVPDDLVVQLSSNSTDVIVPSSVTITKGSSSAQFPIVTPYKHLVAIISASTKYYRETQNIISVQPYTPAINLDLEYPNIIAAGLATNVKATVTDEFGEPVRQATLQFTPGINATVTPHSVLTDKNGIATVSFSSTSEPMAFLTVDASKGGYAGNNTQIAFNVTGTVTAVPVAAKATGFILGLPSWILYVIIAGIVAAAGGGAFMFLRKPKVVEEGEEGEAEI